MGDKLNPAPPGGPFNSYPYSLNFQSSTSVAIIIVVLGATFFFMFLFVVYIKRCSVDQRVEHDPSSGIAAGTASANMIQPQMIHGLDPEILKKFPIMPFSTLSKSTTTKSDPSPFECAVCLGTFEDNELLRLLPACNHLFHPDCIDLWLQSHSTCPLCRRSLSRDAVSGHLQRALAAIAAPFMGSSAPASPTRNASEQDLEAAPAAPAEEPASHQVQILRALSRNSESFKLAAHVLEVQDVRDRLRSGSSARFASPQQRIMTPIACGVMMQHSHSFTELSSVSSRNFVPDEQEELVQSERMKRTMSFSSLQRSLSASSSARV